MKIIILADVHDNLSSLSTALQWAVTHSVEIILSAGDLGNQDTLIYLAQNFSGKIFLIKGNADLYSEDDGRGFPNLRFYGKSLSEKIAGLKIVCTHTPSDLKKKIAEKTIDYDFAFYGHTHRPDFKQENGLIIANPGTLGGAFIGNSFAVLDTKTRKLELKILDNLT